METWRPVVGLEQFYEVSDEGRVRSLDRKVRRRHGIAILGGKVLRPWRNNQGYAMVALSRGDGSMRRALVHRLVLEAFRGPCPPGQEGCHSDGDHSHNHLSNLRWDTPKANHEDRRRHGTIYQLNLTKCPQGHPYEERNLVPSALKRGNRRCLACSRAQAIIQKARRKGLPHESLNELSDEYYREIIG